MRASFSLTSILLGASYVSAASVPRMRDIVPSNETCTILNHDVDYYNGAASTGCTILVQKCKDRVKSLDKWDDPWYFQSCATAAFCHGAENVVNLIKCAYKPNTIPDRADLPAWGRGTYEIMVQWECPSYDCPVTQDEFAINIRNLIDAYGGEEDEKPSKEFIAEYYWKPIVDYKSNDNNTVSYDQFDAWLRTGPGV